MGSHHNPHRPRGKYKTVKKFKKRKLKIANGKTLRISLDGATITIEGRK